ncbi:MAG: hypothetical protein AAF862_12250, partial [Pseudomonadota bacterium]
MISAEQNTDDQTAQSAGDVAGASAAGKGRFSGLEEDRLRREAARAKLLKISAGVAGTVVVIAAVAAAVIPRLSGPKDDVSQEITQDTAQTGPQMDPEELNCDAFLTAPPPPTHPCAQRDRFQELYRVLTTEKVPAIQSSAGVDFVQLALDEMLALEDAGISAFERSNFALAIEKVTAAIEQADRTQAQIS